MYWTDALGSGLEALRCAGSTCCGWRCRGHVHCSEV